MAKAGKEAKLHQISGPPIMLFQGRQCFIDRQQVNGRFFCSQRHFVERNLASFSTRLQRIPMSCTIDQNSAHHLSRSGKKLRAIEPCLVCPTLFESEIHLMNQSGRLQSDSRAFLLQFRGRNPTQLVVNQRQETP